MPQPLRPGQPQRLGRYELLGLLGSGGQGAVYLGRDPEGGLVAVKALHAEHTPDADARRRFRDEVALMRRVAPFCTTRVLDADVDGSIMYIVSEYVEGRSLERLVREDGPRKGGGLDRLAIATLTALAAIHRAGVVHRDFKPANVLLGPEGPVVIDFGIARVLDTTATASGVIGTPAYMSPEQIAGGQIGPASDLFSWAVTMIYGATGRPAFPGTSIPSVMYGVLNHMPDLSGVAEPLRSLIASCLAKDPAARPTAESLLSALTHGRAPDPPGPSDTRRATPYDTQRPAGYDTQRPAGYDTRHPDLLTVGPAPRRTVASSARRQGFVAAGVVAVIVAGAVAVTLVRGGTSSPPVASPAATSGYSVGAGDTTHPPRPGRYPVRYLLAESHGWRLTVVRMDIDENGLTLRVLYENNTTQAQALRCDDEFGGSFLRFPTTKVFPDATVCREVGVGRTWTVPAGGTWDSWGHFPLAGHGGEPFTVNWFGWGEPTRTLTLPPR
ncbi:serine/threonine-protein kinase [Sphaerisporangium aureirubrum]|uniref:Serine/threonine-protein kinase n=1 Tax=Sphaerisporangium aureirubrum TaxID=1544736 RepID=A0ABW1NUX1_9ACTN